MMKDLSRWNNMSKVESQILGQQSEASRQENDLIDFVMWMDICL